MFYLTLIIEEPPNLSAVFICGKLTACGVKRKCIINPDPLRENEMYRLDVSYFEKDEAKALGAKWNAAGKFWYCNELNDGLRRWYHGDDVERDDDYVDPDGSDEERDPYADYKSVTEVNNEISVQFDNTPGFRSILVKGEVTNYKGPNKGNHYFSIKDEQSLLSCVIWASDADRIMRFTLEAGKQVAIKGNLRYFGRYGTNNLHVREIVDMGDGLENLRYLELKKKLEEEGLFDPAHKKPIPKFPKTVGIVTSKNGEALKDIQSIAMKKNPYVQLVLYPVNVQGVNAVRTIIKGIKRLDKENLDTIIVGRGGGSDEELKAYNDEMLARTVYAAKTPIISAVGHTGNQSILDLVADMSVITPTHAADAAIPDVMTTINRVDQLKRMIDVNMYNNFRLRKNQLEIQKNRLTRNDPTLVLQQKTDKLKRLSDDIRNKVVMNYQNTLNRYKVLVARLNGLSPTAKLIDGFGYITSSDKPVRSVNDVKVGDEVSIRIHDGQIKTTVNEVNGK